MRIVITGASGFIGSHLTDALLSRGHEVVACVRNPKAAIRHWPDIEIIEADFSHDHNIRDWAPRLKNIDIVINAVGIIRETRNQTFDDLHANAPIALFRACEQVGVKRVIQISALGADETAFSQYHLSKRRADQCLMALDVEWMIMMPSIVYGPGAKSMAFFKAIAALPLIPLVDTGDQPVQPIHIDDLSQAIMEMIETGRQGKMSIPMVGPQPITMKEIYSQLRHWLGMGKERFVSIPYGLALKGSRLGGFLGNTPMTGETIQMLRKGNTGDVTVFENYFGFTPRGFETVLSCVPSQQSDRWHAGLYFLKPLLRLAIAFLWIFTGVISAFIYPTEQSYAMLAQAGITGMWAPLMLYGAAATDLFLGVATLVSYRLTLVGITQIAVIVLYSVIITFSQPEQWLHPFGPVSKNMPLIVATLIMIVMERR